MLRSHSHISSFSVMGSVCFVSSATLKIYIETSFILEAYTLHTIENDGSLKKLVSVFPSLQKCLCNLAKICFKEEPGYSFHVDNVCVLPACLTNNSFLPSRYCKVEQEHLCYFYYFVFSLSTIPSTNHNSNLFPGFNRHTIFDFLFQVF